MTESFLGARSKERELEFALLSRMTDDLRKIAKKYATDEYGPEDGQNGEHPRTTPILPIPGIEGWSISICTNFEVPILTDKLMQHGIICYNPVEIFVTPTCTDDGKGFVNPELDDDPQFWLALGATGVIDQSANRRLDLDEVQALYRDYEDKILQIFPID